MWKYLLTQVVTCVNAYKRALCQGIYAALIASLHGQRTHLVKVMASFTGQAACRCSEKQPRS